MYELMLGAHIVAFVGNMLAVIVADAVSLWWAMGKVSRLNSTFLKRVHQIIYYGLALSIISGGILVFPLMPAMLQEPVFQLKLAAVGALLINSFLIGKHLSLPGLHAFNELSTKQKRTLFLSGAVSALAWVTVAVCGFLLPV